MWSVQKITQLHTASWCSWLRIILRGIVWSRTCTNFFCHRIWLQNQLIQNRLRTDERLLPFCLNAHLPFTLSDYLAQGLLSHFIRYFKFQRPFFIYDVVNALSTPPIKTYYSRGPRKHDVSKAGISSSQTQNDNHNVRGLEIYRTTEQL